MTAGEQPLFRVGIGTDIHELVPNRKLMLGGVQIPFKLGLQGHSDADVALHAVMDAILGAMGAGDIGVMFPDTDPQYKDADSKGLLLSVRDLMNRRKWEVVNIDLIIHAEEPKLGQFKGQIRRAIAELLGIGFEMVNVKAKTNEGFGDVGMGEAIAATCTVLLQEKIRKL